MSTRHNQSKNTSPTRRSQNGNPHIPFSSFHLDSKDFVLMDKDLLRGLSEK